MTELYTDQHKAMMQSNIDCAKLRTNRIEEIKNFAQQMKFERIGIAHCITFTKEAKVICDYLSQFFEVFIVDCKYGNLCKSNILGGDSRRLLCNPLGQAVFLNHLHTELNISMGLCVGHDMIFSKHSDAFVTNLLDKDFTNKHNPMQVINELK
ncbi:DUF1847 domain-containing protein [Halosquirtibacter laminarini]|uniref:DUF1847 domain-containing protein n=1 Tax=Halosquirtibacter laminarini TaxID=3374600 RepID=A0AC61NJJ5_9BACT|nr:DUF1847 domain-containing protein [Prolixibacteraceae bacterium]